MNNPYSFEKEFKNWFDFHWDVWYNDLTEKQAIENIECKSKGWYLCDGFIYGCYIYRGKK